jgi:hypothetical protein
MPTFALLGADLPPSTWGGGGGQKEQEKLASQSSCSFGAIGGATSKIRTN